MAPVRKGLLIALATILPVAAVFLYSVPPVEGSVYPPCPFHWLTGLHCPGCGTTRCLHALLHGDLAQAAAFNVLALVCLPFLAAWAVWKAYTLFARRPARGFLLPGWCIRVLFVLILAYWVLRNLTISPFDLLAPHQI